MLGHEKITLMQEYINMSYDTREYLRIEEKVRRVRQKKKKEDFIQEYI